MDNDVFIQLAEDYGLETILEQNDLEEWQVLKILFDSGLLDLEDYTYEEIDIYD